MSTLGDRIKTLRSAKDLTQEDLARQLCVNRATLANWEINRTDPDYDSLQQLAKFFGVSTDYLLGLSDDPTPVSAIDNVATAARRLKAIRDSRAMSQRELADRLGISVLELARYESAIEKPPDDLTDKLAELFEVDRRYFTGEIDQVEIEKLLGETWFRAPAKLTLEERQSVEDYIAFIIARRQKKQEKEDR
ncbi:MAG: helix-turn-helix transcriptional regulator [Bacillota bacterium]